MAVQSGVLFFDGRPTNDECPNLAAGLEPLALDGVSTVARDGIAMAFGASHVWTGEESCTQPVESNGGLMMTWDGRLDNRDDLLIRLRGQSSSDIADAEIAMAVFERWGIDGLRLLIGDWSLAIWNSRTHVLHLARDYMGVRPLYYYADRDAVMWSTSVGELALRTGRVDDLNETFVARFMTLQFSPDVTPYTGVRGVPTASCVSFSQKGSETRQRFWRLEPGTIRYRERGQYEEHLRTLWAGAVGTRLRTTGTVWAELSGGLDSSSIVCVADTLIRGRLVPARDLRTVSHVTLESVEGDERRFLREVDAWTGRETDVLGVEAHEAEDYADWSWVTPLAPTGVKARSIRRLHEAGARTVLTGRLGDAIMGCVPDNCVAVFDDLSALRVHAALANMRRWSRACQKPFLEISWSLIRELAGSRSARSACSVAVLSPHLTEVTRNLEPPCDTGKMARLAQRQQARRVLFYTQQVRLEAWVAQGSPGETHPFAHRPLVEYMLAIPGEEVSAPGVTRSLMRRAFAGLVPDRILRRTSKGHYAPVALRGIRSRIKALEPLEQLECVARGWVDANRLSAAIQTLALRGDDNDLGVQLVLRLEHWLASRHRRGPAVIPTRKEVTTNDVRIA